MNKNIKIISGISILGVLTIAAVTPIIVIAQKNKKGIKEANEELKTIITKLDGKEVTISKEVNISNKDLFRKAIIKVLKDDSTIDLTDEQLDKVDSVSEIIPKDFSFHTVTLKIKVDKADIKNEVEIKVRTTKTNKQKANEKIAIDKALFDNYSEKTLKTKINSLKEGDITIIKLQELVLIDDKNLTLPNITSGVTRTYSIKTNQDTGIANVTVTFFAPDGDEAKTTFIIKGFKTKIDIANTLLGKIKSELNNKAIILDPATILTDNNALRDAIITKLKEADSTISLTDSEIEMISSINKNNLTDDFNDHDVTLTLTVDNANNPQNTVNIKVKQNKTTDEQQQVDIIKYFTDNNNDKKIISIPNTTSITDNQTLLAAIKKVIGVGLTDNQKESISIETDYKIIDKGFKKNIKIGIKFGSASKDDSIMLEVTHEKIKLNSTKKITDFIKELNDYSIRYNIYMRQGLNINVKVNKDSDLFALDDVKGYNSSSKFKRYFFHQKKWIYMNNPEWTDFNNVINALKKVGITFKDENALQTELKKNFNETEINDINFTKSAGGSHDDHTNLFGYFFKVTDDNKVTLCYSITYKNTVYIQSVNINFAQ